MAYNYLNSKTIKKGPRIEISTFGQWDEAIRELQLLDPAIKKASVKAQMSVLKDFSKIVKGHITHQDLGWPQLKDSYATQKNKAGRDNRILVSSGTYLRSINVWKSGNRHIAMVGVRRGIYTRELNGRRSRIDVATIAYIHEFSKGGKLPRRPLWNPSIREYGGVKSIKKKYVDYLFKELKKSRIRYISKSFINRVIF